MLTVIAIAQAKPGKEKSLEEALLALVAPTRREAGCINYDLHQSAADPAIFMLYENWVSMQDLDAHLAMPYLEAFKAKAPELLAEPLDISLWKKI